MRCRRGYYFLPWVLNFSIGTHWDVNIKDLCSSRVYKHNLQIWSRLGDLVRCILSFNFGAQELYI